MIDYKTQKESLKPLVELWKKTGLLKGLDEYHQAQVCVLMENQRLYNDHNRNENDPRAQMFQRNSIPIVRRVFDPKSLVIANMISLQTLLGPTGLLYHTNTYGVLDETECAAKTRILKTGFPMVLAEEATNTEGMLKYIWGDNLYIAEDLAARMGGMISQTGLDNEAELTLYLTECLINEISSEILGDLSQHAATQQSHDWKSADHLTDSIRLLVGLMERKAVASNMGIWIAASPALAEEIASVNPAAKIEKANDPDFNLSHFAQFGRYALYVNKTMPVNEVLVGMRGDELNSGYIYAPYVFLGPLNKPDGRMGMMTRYTKKLVKPAYYGKITVRGYSAKEADNG